MAALIGIIRQIEATEGQPLTWERISKFHCLVLYNLPADQGQTIPGALPGPPFRPDFQALLDRYLKAGGGVLIDVSVPQRTEAIEELLAAYLAPWGAKLPLEKATDPATQVPHPRLQNQPFLAAEVIPSPVSEGVRSVWFPCGTGGYNWEQYGGLIEVSSDWTEVLRGSATCTTEPLRPTMALGPTERYSKPQYVRNGVTKPTLFAVRELPSGGRLALMNAWNVFHLGGGTTWVHDRAMLDRGLAGKPSDFGRLLENTFRWLAAPAAKAGLLGGYQQDPEKLRMPTERLKAQQMFPAAEWQQNPTPPRRVYRGLIGACSAASGGTGTVADYAAAAKRSGLDFVVFLEDFAQLTEPAYRKLEADCRGASKDEVLLLPGFRIDTNLGTHYFAYGWDIPWLEGPQLAGPSRQLLRLQQFDEKGLLALDDQAVHNWQFAVMDFASRNLGYYDCRANQRGTPIYNLRMFGMLAVMTYRQGKLVEDITPEYLDYVADTIPPRACAVDLVDSPDELQRAVGDGHYLTHIAVENLAKVPEALCHGHQYGRPNVYPSQGPGDPGVGRHAADHDLCRRAVRARPVSRSARVPGDLGCRTQGDRPLVRWPALASVPARRCKGVPPDLRVGIRSPSRNRPGGAGPHRPAGSECGPVHLERRQRELVVQRPAEQHDRHQPELHPRRVAWPGGAPGASGPLDRLRADLGRRPHGLCRAAGHDPASPAILGHDGRGVLDGRGRPDDGGQLHADALR